MNSIYKIIVAVFLALGITACTAVAPNVEEANKGQSVQVITAPNADGAITTKSIGAAFEKSGFVIGGNNNMNSPFEQRFHHVHYKVYNLAMFSNADMVLKLIKKYPNFGALSPLTMSIWSDDSANTMNISALSLEGMSKAVGIPANDPDLIAYAAMVKTALQTAMPGGKFQKLNFPVKEQTTSFEQEFVMDISPDGLEDLQTFREDFEAELEGELEPLGFLLPGYSDLKDEIFDPAGYEEYDFYVTYSICKFDVIYPVSKLHPEAGAWAPCSMYMYKKKGEDKMHIGYLGVDSWITTLDIQDKESTEPLYEAQGMINNILKSMTSF